MYKISRLSDTKNCYYECYEVANVTVLQSMN